MEQILSADVASNLYWLGRHIQRIEKTLYLAIIAFDKIIDEDKEAGKILYKSFGIDLQYTNAQDFLFQALTAQHPSNIQKLSSYAKENAIICRNYLNIEAFGEIIALNQLFQRVDNNPNLIDYKIVDTAQSLISEMWGEMSKKEHRNTSDHFLKIGKLIEKLDFSFTYKEIDEDTDSIISDILRLINLTADKPVKIDSSLSPQQTVKMISSLVDAIIVT